MVYKLQQNYFSKKENNSKPYTLLIYLLLVFFTASCAITLPAMAASVESSVVKIIVIGNPYVQADYSYYYPVNNYGHGSGTIISEDGVILTAKHVVADARLIIVQMPGTEKYYLADTVYLDPVLDFAYIYIYGKDFKYISLPKKPEDIERGEKVSAMGYPIDIMARNCTVEKGEITSFDIDWIQHNAPTIGGMSGGPVLNSDDDIVGVTMGGYQTGSTGIKLNRAVKLNKMISKLKELQVDIEKIKSVSSKRSAIENNFRNLMFTYWINRINYDHADNPNEEQICEKKLAAVGDSLELLFESNSEKLGSNCSTLAADYYNLKSIWMMRIFTSGLKELNIPFDEDIGWYDKIKKKKGDEKARNYLLFYVKMLYTADTAALYDENVLNSVSGSSEGTEYSYPSIAMKLKQFKLSHRIDGVSILEIDEKIENLSEKDAKRIIYILSEYPKYYYSIKRLVESIDNNER